MIIGLHGKMGAGKNEAARRLALLSALPVVEVSFARKLKESAAALLGCTVDDLERWKNDPASRVAVLGWNTSALGPQFTTYEAQTVRSFLQRYGTEAHREVFGSDFWLDVALPFDGDTNARGYCDGYDDALYVVTDARFPNEGQRVRDLGGVVLGIRGPNENTGDHASEQTIECDEWIDNIARDDNYATLDLALAGLLLRHGLALKVDAA